MTESPLRATVVGLLDQLRASRRRLAADVRADGESILVTGASSGLGLALTEALAARGAHVIMACRSRREEAPAEVRRAVDGAALSVIGVDLTRPAEVDALADALVGRGVVLDRLVLNAGVVPLASRTTEAGLDLMVHVNFVANVQLVQALRARGRLREGARVVVIGSEAHRSAPPIDLDGWMRPSGYPTSQVLAAYGASKRLLHTWAEALAADAPGLEVVQLCPGAIASNIAREAPRSMAWLLTPVMRLLFPSPARVASWVSWVVLGHELDGRTGVYLHLGREKAPGNGVRDPVVVERLWRSAHAVVAQMRAPAPAPDPHPDLSPAEEA